MDTVQFSQPRYSWEWLIGIGSLLILFGIVAIAAPIASSVGLAWVLGALLLASGIAQLVHSFRFMREAGTVSRFLLAALSIVAGIIILRNPVAGAVAATLALAFYLLTSAVGKWIMAFEIRPAKGWGFLFVSALISLVLGVFLIVIFPQASLVVPGIFLGVDLIFYGGSMIGLSFMVHRIEHEVRERERPAA